MLCVTEFLIIEFTEGPADINFVALLPGIEDIGRGVGGIGELDGENIAVVLPAQSILGLERMV